MKQDIKVIPAMRFIDEKNDGIHPYYADGYVEVNRVVDGDFVMSFHTVTTKGKVVVFSSIKFDFWELESFAKGIHEFLRDRQ